MPHNCADVVATLYVMSSGSSEISESVGRRHIVAQHEIWADKISCFHKEKKFNSKVSPLSPRFLTSSIQSMCAMNSDELLWMFTDEWKNIDSCKVINTDFRRLTGTSLQEFLHRSTESHEVRLGRRRMSWNDMRDGNCYDCTSDYLWGLKFVIRNEVDELWVVKTSSGINNARLIHWQIIVRKSHDRIC